MNFYIAASFPDSAHSTVMNVRFTC